MEPLPGRLARLTDAEARGNHRGTMAMPLPYAEADDLGVVEGCIAQDPDAWKVLERRFGSLIRTITARVVDERRGGSIDEVPACEDAVLHHLRHGDGSPLHQWSATPSLRPFLAVITRQVTLSRLQDVTPPAVMLGRMTTAAALFLDGMLGAAAEPSKSVTAALDRLPPHVGAMVRLRIRGLGRADIATTLGKPRQAVSVGLDHVAERLADLEGTDRDMAQLSWRVLLDAASIPERVQAALRTDSDPRFRKARALSESTWRGVRERALTQLLPRTPQCLDENALAGFVDGSLRGAERTRAEGHLATCARCVDTVANVSTDMRAIEALRDAEMFDTQVAIAASCIATARFRAGAQLAEVAAREGSARAKLLLRLAHIGRAVDQSVASPAEPSRVVAMGPEVPTDDEAPLVALEALVENDPRSAGRAIDDQLARGTLGARLRLLAAVAGDDVEEGRARAEALVERSHSDPGLMGDASAALALPEGVPLPREILIERVRTAIPAAVRYITTR